MTPVFHYGTSADGKPVARPIASAHAGLAAFLTEEASWDDYIGLLLDLADEAARAETPRVNTGNAYAVTIDGALVSIEHLHRAGQPPDTLAVAVFVEALREWRAFLNKPRA